ncbi:MAG: CRTAC1 family protein, partial [Candidatus Kapaibacterium sp.]
TYGRSVVIRVAALLMIALAFSPAGAMAQHSMMMTGTDTTAHGTQPEGTVKMIALLKKAAESFMNNQNPYSSLTRIKLFEEYAKQEPFNNFQLTQEMLNAGETREAIAKLEGMRSAHKGLDGTTDNIDRILGIAYLRIGEEENCVVNHTAQSCILPIRPEGFHKLPYGSRSAIGVYTELLARHPDDLQSRWLLNVAYMTLGLYPDSVPHDWLIPPSVFKSDYDLPRFNDIAPDLGLDTPGLSGGCAVEDFDRDGNLDIMVSTLGVNDQLHYIHNNGDGIFTDRTVAAGLTGITGGLNMVHADYNNDGYPDIFVTRGGWFGTYGHHPNSLLRNNGDGTFTDVTIDAGLLSFHPTQTAAFADFNNDGRLDLFIGNESTPPLDTDACELYMNNGNGTFTNVAREVGLDLKGFVKGSVWGDYNNDGLPDLYLSIMAAPNRLYKNNGKGKNGKWSFTDVAEKAGVRDPQFSFPTFFFDYNNDGWEDIFVCGYGLNGLSYINSSTNVASLAVADYLGMPSQGIPPKLYKNNGDGTFTDVTHQMHVDKILLGMGINYGDLDNDGWPDFYVGTGAADYNVLVPNRMFRNNGGEYFQDVTTSGGFGHLQKGHAIAFADIDNDGDQDIYEVMGGAWNGDVAHKVLFQNPGNGNHWITILLEGVQSNRDAIGARITVRVINDKGMRDIHATVSTGGSFGSQSLQQEIGLGDAHKIESITVTWPRTGKKQVFTGVAMDQSVNIREGDAEAKPFPRTIIKMGGGMPSDGGTMEHHHHME